MIQDNIFYDEKCRISIVMWCGSSHSVLGSPLYPSTLASLPAPYVVHSCLTSLRSVQLSLPPPERAVGEWRRRGGEQSGETRDERRQELGRRLGTLGTRLIISTSHRSSSVPYPRCLSSFFLTPPSERNGVTEGAE